MMESAVVALAECKWLTEQPADLGHPEPLSRATKVQTVQVDGSQVAAKHKISFVTIFAIRTAADAVAAALAPLAKKTVAVLGLPLRSPELQLFTPPADAGIRGVLLRP
jgi:hypothetical protein